ncbi:endoribonuclease [Cupriavidus basilensis OR16]|uniref:Endoribonuclease n=1 Tax=Cupriavidus basilensis OR16 TaxID=1127483 RepID=H1S4V2_9BURK|nr:RidA family protein [Cupriavidus basilensis]EHP42436.1 endoribonuclease [Cupriavidus basilensis OR16]
MDGNQPSPVVKAVSPAGLSVPGGHYSHATVANGLHGIEHWPAFNAIYAAWAGSARPARAVVPTGALHFGLKVEVEAVAVLLPAA